VAELRKTEQKISIVYVGQLKNIHFKYHGTKRIQKYYFVDLLIQINNQTK